MSIHIEDLPRESGQNKTAVEGVNFSERSLCLSRRLHTSTTSISWSVEAVQAAGAIYAKPLEDDPEYTKIPIVVERLHED